MKFMRGATLVLGFVSLFLMILILKELDQGPNLPPPSNPNPPPAAGPAVTITHRVEILDMHVPAAQVDWVIYDMTDDGEPAIMQDPITGVPITAPDLGRAPVPFEYHDTLAPGVVYSEAEFVVTGVPPGATVLCETVDAAGNQLDVDVQQQTQAGPAITVRCIYSKPA